MPKKKTKILLITLFFADILIAGVFAFVYISTKNLITESVNKEDQIKAELKKENAAVIMKEDLALAKVYQEKLNNYVINSNGTVAFIELLENMIIKSGLKSDIRNVATEAYKKSGVSNVELLRVNADVVGEWKNVQYFLNLLENYPLQINIEKVSINKFSDLSSKGKSISQWAGSFEFTVLKIKDTK